MLWIALDCVRARRRLKAPGHEREALIIVDRCVLNRLQPVATMERVMNLNVAVSRSVSVAFLLFELRQPAWALKF
jgi:hypothetical protein